jgi:phosphinothricin acetyltransferase
MIRKAIISDLEDLTKIYNQAIKTKKATAHLETFTPAQRVDWFNAYTNERTPLFVYEEDGCVVGYCSLSPYRPGRQALKYVAEISYYVDFNHHGKGIGSKLVCHTIDAARVLGYKSILAVLLSGNEASVAIIKKFNFEKWGIMPDIAEMGENVYSHWYFGLKLVEDDMYAQ